MKRTPKIKKQISDTLKSICIDSDVMLIGLTGGIATGKSTVAEMFRGFGAVIIDFDLLARSIVEPYKESWQLITDYFGKDILNSDLSINRKKLSDIVFKDPDKREKLESFTHPFIWKEFLNKTENAVIENGETIILVVVPLLIEGNMQELFLKNILVYAPQETQMIRLMQRDRIDRKKAQDILSAQIPVDEKIAFVDFVINNDGLPEDTKEQVRTLWHKLIKVRKENTQG